MIRETCLISSGGFNCCVISKTFKFELWICILGYLYRSKRSTGHDIPLINVFGTDGLHGQGHVIDLFRNFFSFHTFSKYILEMVGDVSKDKLNL